MSWNPVNEAKKLVHKAEDAIKKGIKDVEHARDSAKNSVNWVKDHAKKEVYKVKDDCKKFVKDAGETVKKDVIGEISEAGNTIKHEFESVENKAKGALSEAEDGLSKVKNEIEDLPKKIEKVAEDVIEKLSQQVLSEAIEKGLELVKTTHSELAKLEKSKPELVDEINNLGFNLKIGPIAMSWDSFYERAEDLTSSLETFHKNGLSLHRKPILEFIGAIGPTAVNPGIDVNLAALVVSSDSLGVGVELSDIRLKLFLELGDIILQKLGVPE